MIRFGRITTVLASIAVAGAMMTTSAHATASHAKFRGYNVGLELYTVRDECAKDFPGVLKKVAEMGYKGVEFAGYWGKSAEDIKKMLDEDHLQCYGSHTPWNDLQPENIAKTIAFNHTIGNKLIVVPWIPTEKRNSKAAILATCKEFNAIAKTLEKEGIMLGYHNHMDEFKPVDGEMPWDTFFANTDSRVKIQFDTGNAMDAGQQAAPFLVKYPGRIISIHFKDHSTTNPNALLGEGDEHWNEVVPILKKITKPKYYIIEQEVYPFGSLECARRCLRTFEKMMN